MKQWVNYNINSKKDRYQSLLLIGETKTGKTSWAKSLGRHIHWSGIFALDEWDYLAQYIIIDDFNWTDRIILG